MKVLICGGRDFNDYEYVERALAALPFLPSLIIQGGAKGADTLAKLWSKKHGVHSAQVDALWDTYGKSAGHKRNSTMLTLAEYVIAFPGGAGTKNMIAQAKAVGLPVWELTK